MAFASTVKHKTRAGDLQIRNGTWNAAGVITGNINTGMTYLYDITLTEKGGTTAAGSSGVFVDETVPGAVGTAVTIHCKENASGTYTAIGR